MALLTEFSAPFVQTVRRHRASFRNANAAIVRVFTRHTFTLLDDARTTFVPLDLMPRLMCRAHAVAAVRKLGGAGGGMPLVWRDGCVYELGSGCVATLSLEEQHLLVRGAVVAMCGRRAVQYTGAPHVPRLLLFTIRLTCVASTRTTCGGAWWHALTPW